MEHYVGLLPWFVIIITLLLIVIVDWRKHWRMSVGLVITGLFIILYISGCYAVIPGLSPFGASIDQITHLRPLAIQVTGVASTKLDKYAKPLGEYLVIGAIITNTGNEPIRVVMNSELRDIWGRRFGPGGFQMETYTENLNPGLSIRTTLLFDVPSAHGIWWMTMYPNENSKTNGVTIPIVMLY